jgi:hypothetical protein
MILSVRETDFREFGVCRGALSALEIERIFTYFLEDSNPKELSFGTLRVIGLCYQIPCYGICSYAPSLRKGIL